MTPLEAAGARRAVGRCSTRRSAREVYGDAARAACRPTRRPIADALTSAPDRRRARTRARPRPAPAPSAAFSWARSAATIAARAGAGGARMTGDVRHHHRQLQHARRARRVPGVARTTHRPRRLARIVVVDNASSDGSAELVRVAAGPPCALIALDRESRLRRGQQRRRSARRSAPFVLLLNSDTRRARRRDRQARRARCSRPAPSPPARG